MSKNKIEPTEPIEPIELKLDLSVSFGNCYKELKQCPKEVAKTAPKFENNKKSHIIGG